MPRTPNPYEDAPRLPETPSVDVRALVPAAASRLEIEIGPGRGGFLFERLEAAPDVVMVGLEIRRKWAKIVDDRLRARGFGPRGRVFAEDAKDALVRLGPDASVDAFFVHFPDPWWKKRHAKRLVVSPVLLDQIARLLKPGGTLFVQTDVEERLDAYDAQISSHGAFVLAGDAPGTARIADHAFVARSPRERRSIDDGIPIYRVLFRRAG